MDFENLTPWPAKLFRGMIRDNKLFGSLVCRVTFDWVATELVPAEEQPWIVSPGPWDCPKGPAASDELFYRGGVDLFVFGEAKAPDGRATSKMEVTVEAGKSFQQTIAVIGDRVWEGKRGKYQPTAPKPFVSMPLTLAHAYGGKDVWDELPIPYSINPDGKGFRQYEELVPGTPLPNLENPKQPIREWTDRPEPVGVGMPPPLFPPKIMRFVEFDLEKHEIKRIHPKFFNHAFPDMIAPPLQPGDEVRIKGMKPTGVLKFTIPPTPVRHRVEIEQNKQEGLSPIDQIGIDVEKSQVFITYRFAFHYFLNPLERRICELKRA